MTPPPPTADYSDSKKGTGTLQTACQYNLTKALFLFRTKMVSLETTWHSTAVPLPALLFPTTEAKEAHLIFMCFTYILMLLV